MKTTLVDLIRAVDTYCNTKMLLCPNEPIKPFASASEVDITDYRFYSVMDNSLLTDTYPALCTYGIKIYWIPEEDMAKIESAIGEEIVPLLPKYAIIDLEYLRKNRILIDIDSEEFKVAIRYQKAILSPEETEAKWSEVWEQAVKFNEADFLSLERGIVNNEMPFDEFKKNL